MFCSTDSSTFDLKRCPYTSSLTTIYCCSGSQNSTLVGIHSGQVVSPSQGMSWNMSWLKSNQAKLKLSKMILILWCHYTCIQYKGRNIKATLTGHGPPMGSWEALYSNLSQYGPWLGCASHGVTEEINVEFLDLHVGECVQQEQDESEIC